MIFSTISTGVFLLIGFQLPPQTDASDDNSPVGCLLDGTIFPNGSRTSANRCIQYHCTKGVWEFLQINPACSECDTSVQTNITTFDVHKIDGILTPSYHFNGCAGPICASYGLTQTGLNYPQLRVNAIFVNTDVNESRIIYVAYTEPGITVAFSISPNNDAEITVNGNPTSLSHNGSMTSFKSAVGTVFISNDSPSWPQPFWGGNILIVGSQGISVSIYALRGFAWFVKIYAMPFLERELYGLCDVFTPGSFPENYTMQNGAVTTNITEFTESWEVPIAITDNRSSDGESPDDSNESKCGEGESKGGICIPNNSACSHYQKGQCPPAYICCTKCGEGESKGATCIPHGLECSDYQNGACPLDYICCNDNRDSHRDLAITSSNETSPSGICGIGECAHGSCACPPANGVILPNCLCPNPNPNTSQDTFCCLP